MKKTTPIFLTLSCLMSLNSPHVFAEESTGLIDAISSGKAYLDLRLRYEMVDQDGFAENANATTLRTKLGYKTGSYKGFSGTLEFENSTNIFADNYNSTTNGNGTYPVVADPQSTAVTPASIAYTGIKNTTIVAGRQAVNLGNQRFVGTVGFRQNDQTYDAVAIINTSIKDTTLLYGYVWNVNRIFGDDHPYGDLGTTTHLFNADYKGIKGLKIGAYAYLIDLDDAAVWGLSSQTFGVRVSGKFAISNDVKLLYNAEYASQSDYANNPLSYSTRYLLGEIGVKFSGLTLKAGYESLGSDEGNVSFKTPLATLHKFNGWADKFLNTPAGGLNDMYVTAIYVVKSQEKFLNGLKFILTYHDFKSQFGSVNYGSEFDALIAKKINKTFSVSVKYANYSADNFASNTSKLWMTLGAKF